MMRWRRLALLAVTVGLGGLAAAIPRLGIGPITIEKNAPGEPNLREAQGCAYDGKLYVFGGFKYTCNKGCSKFDYTTKETWAYTVPRPGVSGGWSPRAPMPGNHWRGNTHCGNVVDHGTGMICKELLHLDWDVDPAPTAADLGRLQFGGRPVETR